MKIGVLGSGNVGQALAKGFIAEGHQVYLATREPKSEKAEQLRSDIPNVVVCTFAEAAGEAELAVLCTPWAAAADALKLADAEETLGGKVLVDTNNALERTDTGVQQVLSNKESAGEAVQTWLPNSRVVKCWNIVGANVYYKPDLGLTPTMFLAGNDEQAKAQVADLVHKFGWETLDAGDITASRQLEALAVLWINYTGAVNDRNHAFKML